MCSLRLALASYISVDAVQALAEKNAAIAESERCQRKLGLANRLIAALASEGDRWALTVQQLRKDYQVTPCTCLPWVSANAWHQPCVCSCQHWSCEAHCNRTVTLCGVFVCRNTTSMLVEAPCQTCSFHSLLQWQATAGQTVKHKLLRSLFMKMS